MAITPIRYGEVPNVLLLGNGINQSFGENSWDSVMELISTGEYDHDEVSLSAIKSLPNTLQTIIISSDSVGDGMKQLAEKMMPKAIKVGHADLIRKYANIPFDAILTTNYTYEIEQALDPKFKLTMNKASKYRMPSKLLGSDPQKQFGIFNHIEVENQAIWHIHGEAARPNSMVMGHYYYGKLLSEIQKRVPEFICEYEASKKEKKDFIPKSWIDYFLIGNVYIVGFGMNPSEMDLWWLINCKKRHFKDSSKAFFYEPNLYTKKQYPVKVLAEIFDMRIKDYQIKGKEYRQFYERLVTDVENDLMGCKSF
jgi:hypothetical protein